MKISAYLWKSRHGIWYFRAVIPPHLRSHFPYHQREIRRSLSTGCRREAVPRARAYRVEFDALLASYECGVKKTKQETYRTGLITGVSLDLGGGRTLKIEKIDHEGDHDKERETLRAAIAAASPPPTPSKDTPTNAEGPLLSTLAAKYVGEKVRGKHWKPKTESQNRADIDLLIRIVGDIPVNTLDHSRASHYEDVMARLPANAKKVKAYRDLSIDEILALPHVEAQDITTQINRMRRASAFIGWCKKKGHVQVNPLEGKVPKEARGHRDEDDRDPWTPDELRSMFDGYPYTGRFPSRAKPYSYTFWLPVLGLYTGARLNELCQLYLADIKQEDGIWCIQHNDDKPDKSLKNAHSRRIVPVHSRLIEMGFIDFTKLQKEAGHERLFPCLVKHRDGYGHNASKWFARYRKKYELVPSKDDSRKVDFHSFRHNVINGLKQRTVQSELIAGIVGHGHGSETLDRYGKTYEPKALVNAVESITYPGLDLSHLNYHVFLRRRKEQRIEL